VLGPCIHPAAYEFSASDLKPITNQFGIGVQSETQTGKPALDLPALVAQACQQQGWGELTSATGEPACTSGPSYFSHRTRADTGRQTMVGWIQQ
jgi:copper oxidase (laccase) domain-containing protein